LTRKPDHQEEQKLQIATSNRDRPEYERLRKGIIKLLEKFGVYEPALDDILVGEIASSTIYYNNAEKFLDAANANELTYSRIIDCKLKCQKMIETAIRELALSRRERLSQQSQTDFTRQLQEAIAKAKMKKHE